MHLPVNNFITGVLMGLYGVSVIASGLWRFLSAEGGHTGLTFGIVMGLIAFASGWLISSNKTVPGFSLAWICVLLAGGWFIYEALVKKGFENAETRQLVVIVISVAVGLILATRLAAPPPEKDSSAPLS